MLGWALNLGFGGSSQAAAPGLTAQQIWDYELVPGVSAGTMVVEIWRDRGLDSVNPKSVSDVGASDSGNHDEAFASAVKQVRTTGNVTTITRTS